MQLKDISLDQWQDLENLIKSIEDNGINHTTGCQLAVRFSPIGKIFEEYKGLFSDCMRLNDILKKEDIIEDDKKIVEILKLLKNISKEYQSFLKDMSDDDGYKVCKSDNLSTRYYRHLQTRWREYKGLPVKKKKGQSNKDVYGNYTSDPDGNFMTPNIIQLVNDELTNKGDRLIDESRLRENLLSSQPLCFNLFGELKKDKDKALQFFNSIYNGYFNSIDDILFEYNPARRDPRLTGDRSAFDVFVKYTSKDEKKGFMGIEVKYSETLREGTDSVQDILNKQFCDENRTRRDRYQELSEGLFKQEDFDKLEKLPYFQIWRDHLLAVSMLKAFPEEYQEGFFVFLSPYTNKQCRDGAKEYRKLLEETDPIQSHFDIKWSEDFLDTLNIVFGQDWTEEMGWRYIGRKPKNGKKELKCNSNLTEHRL